MFQSRPVQDENSGAPVHSKGFRDVENSATAGKPSAKAPRKALGNITNVTGRTEKVSKGKPPSSTLPPPRKLPFGDLTNSFPPVKPAAPKQAAKQLQAAPAAVVKSRLDALAEQYAKDGVENLAGKGWKQLKEDAENRQDEAIAARVAAITSIPYHLPVAVLSQQV